MSKKPYPDISINVSDSGRRTETFFSCPGLCKFALCENMPPEDDDVCTFAQHGNCMCAEAHAASLKACKSQVGKALKELEEERSEG